MTLIDGDKLADSIKDRLCDHLYCWDCSMQLEDGGCKVEKWLDDAPSIDIVRCKECKWYKQSEAFCENGNGLCQAGNECFCSYGERKESDDA